MKESASNNASQQTGRGYLFDNAGRETPSRFAALSALYDDETKRHLNNRGIRKGWRCLEIGGGGGSIANWLADRVGPNGHVLVTDIDPRFLQFETQPNVEVRRHDIGEDSLPEGAFDLVHARLVLLHVYQRQRALQKMIAALKPGGWLVDEEFDSLSLVADPTLRSGELLLKTYVAFARLLANSGVERRFGRLLFGLLRDQGLTEVSSEGRMCMWQSRSAGVSLMRANYEQARGDMIRAGYLTSEEFEADMAILQDPDFLMPSPIMWTASGQRPNGRV